MLKTKNIRQEIVFKASAHDIYEALMDSKKHSQFTGSPAKIGRAAGGSFSTFGGYATGKNLELVRDKKIVQRWIASDWPEGSDSTVTFVLKPIKGGTKLVFTHKNVPADFVDSISDVWKTYYWKPMKKMLEK